MIAIEEGQVGHQNLYEEQPCGHVVKARLARYARLCSNHATEPFGEHMKPALVTVAFAAGLLTIGASTSERAPSHDDSPRFTSDGKLFLPENYREWIFLSSGLGMSYGPL